MTPQNATLNSKRTLPWLVSYRRLSPQLQLSLSPTAVDTYLYDRNGLHAKHSEEIGAVPYRYFVTSLFYLHLFIHVRYPLSSVQERR